MADSANSLNEVETLKKRLAEAKIPNDLCQIILNRAVRIFAAGQFVQLEQLLEYIEWIVSLPWQNKTDDTLDLIKAKTILDSGHYGLTEIKERVLEYIAVMKLQKESHGLAKNNITPHAPILCFVGITGTGKTTIAEAISHTLGRKFVRIPFGGLGDPGMLRGVARFTLTGGEPGQVVKALRRSGVKNPVILLDEIDRVVPESRASIMGVLVEMLDPEQNHAFMDSYIDYPFDLSEVLFIATANNTTNIATAVLDRLEIMQMPSYSNEEKIAIGREFMLPKALEEAGIPALSVQIADSVWPLIVRPLGFDAGTRTMERTIEGMVRKIAREIVEGKAKTFKIDENTIKQYIPMW